MKCLRCQHENEAGAKFCEECATPLARACTKCGRQLSPTAKFCPECAQPIGLSAAQPQAPRFGSPESYTPRHLVEKIVTSKAALEGERKQVTVLFADLKGSMELLADRDPEEARRLLDPVLELMMEAVHRYEGTVNQVMGDGIMALFGAPLAHEDHAVRACYAALRMQESVKKYNEAVQQTEGVPIQIRVGLNSGEVVVRSIGSDLRIDYTAVGQSTHLAARMEQLADPGSILLTADTLRLTEGYVDVRPLGPMRVKGLEVSVDVHELVGAGPVRSRFQATAARGLSHFVGRWAEMEGLLRALTLVGEGRGQVVAVVGDAGVGKSRLIHELTRSDRLQEWLILEAGSVSYGRATSYLPVIDLLRKYFGISGRDAQRGILEKVTGKLLERALERDLPALLSLLDVPVEEVEWQRLDPLQRRRHTLEAVKRLLVRESARQPVLVIFEDLHWVDGESQSLLDALVEGLPALRLLLLVTYRPEYAHGWGAKACYTQIRLDPLPAESASELLQALLGAHPTVAALKPLLLERTGGNPFFLEESVRTLVELRALIGERGAYRLDRPSETIQVPATVQAILAARIDRLDPTAKGLLQAAAVVGKDVPSSVLQAIADLPDHELREAISRLQYAAFVYEAKLFPDPEYTFTHALTHDVAYGSVLIARRRALHGRIVDTIETLSADRVIEHAAQLAHHALRGEQWERALLYARQAAAKAQGRSAYREAVSCLEQALQALERIRPDPETLRQAIDVRLDLRNALFAFGDHAQIILRLREAAGLARALGDQRRLGRVSAILGLSLWATGEHQPALQSVRQAESLGITLGDETLEVLANFYLGVALHAVGDYRAAVTCLARNVETLGGDRWQERFGLMGPTAIYCASFLAWSAAELGDLREACRRGEEAIRLADSLGEPYTQSHALVSLSLALIRIGDLAQVSALLERAVALCETWDLPIWLPDAAAGLGYTYAWFGRATEGVTLLERALREVDAMNMRTRRAPILVYLAEVLLLAGRLLEARARVDEALALALELGERGHEAWALRLLGEIEAREEPLKRGAAHLRYDEALRLATDLGMRPLVAHCHLGLGKLHRRTSNREQAREHLTTATTMYREMDMRFWLEQAMGETAALG